MLNSLSTVYMQVYIYIYMFHNHKQFVHSLYASRFTFICFTINSLCREIDLIREDGSLLYRGVK